MVSLLRLAVLLAAVFFLVGGLSMLLGAGLAAVGGIWRFVSA